MVQTDKAIDALIKAIELNPDIVQAWANLINAYIQQDAIAKAIETGKKLIEKAPDFSLGYNNLAVAYYHNHDYKKAIEHLDKAKELGFQVHPDFIETLEPYRNR